MTDQGRRGRHAINAIRHPHRPVEWLVETKPHRWKKGAVVGKRIERSAARELERGGSARTRAAAPDSWRTRGGDDRNIRVTIKVTRLLGRRHQTWSTESSLYSHKHYNIEITRSMFP